MRGLVFGEVVDLDDGQIADGVTRDEPRCGKLLKQFVDIGVTVIRQGSTSNPLRSILQSPFAISQHPQVDEQQARNRIEVCQFLVFHDRRLDVARTGHGSITPIPQKRIHVRTAPLVSCLSASVEDQVDCALVEVVQESPAAPISSPNHGWSLKLKREMKRRTNVLVANRRMELDLERRLYISKTWPIERGRVPGFRELP